MEDLWCRRQMLGPDEPKPRSTQGPWNYDAELFAFGKRLGEQFREGTLRQAFTHSSFKTESDQPAIDENDEKSKKAGQISHHNEQLISLGDDVITAYVPAYLRYHFPKFPEEGIKSVAGYLTSENQLAYLAKNLGMKDLILAEGFPFDDSVMCKTFRAVVGALAADSGMPKAEYFVQDFVMAELVDLDVNEIFYVDKPIKILERILLTSNRGAPESRIIRQTGVFTITPTYVIGIYSDKQLLGEAPGESIDIAEDLAARDCLKRIWETHEQRAPLKFGVAGRKFDLSQQKKHENQSLYDMMGLKDSDETFVLTVSDPYVGEPFSVEAMLEKYDTVFEPALGQPRRKKLMHKYYHGTPCKWASRALITPNVRQIS